MKQTCPECKSIIEIDESKYKPGEIVKKNCPLCDTEVSFSIPLSDMKDKEKIQELESVIQDLLKDKNERLKKEKAIKERLARLEKKENINPVTSILPSSKKQLEQIRLEGDKTNDKWNQAGWNFVGGMIALILFLSLRTCN